MESAIEQIQVALANSLSLSEQLRSQALDFLSTQCEPNPQFQQALLHIVKSNGGASASPEQKQLQYQAIICMKNSLTRILSTNKRRVFKGSQMVELSEELKDEIKAQLLALVQAGDTIVSEQNAFEQLVLVLCIFAQYDFPVKWTELHAHMLNTFESIFTSLAQLGEKDLPAVNRFLHLYVQIMKVQNKKKLITSKGQFNKVARDHLKAVHQLWSVFSERQTQMFIREGQLDFGSFSPTAFQLASKLDKCICLMLACGFNLNDLLNEPSQNSYIRVVGQLIDKLRRYAFLVEQVAGKAELRQFQELFLGQMKNILRHLSELQNQEALILYEHLGVYIETLAEILFKGSLYPQKICKICVFSLYRVVNTQAYNQGSEKPSHSDGIGILVSPSKFKNFEPQLQEAGDQYKFIFEKPDPDSQDPKVKNRKDGARKLIELIYENYLSLSSFNLWKESPEQFIELEDQSQFISEYDIDSDCSLALLSYQLLEKLISCFYETSYGQIHGVLLKNYFSGQLKPKNEFVEDSLFTLTGMLGKIQRELKVPSEKRLDVNYVLSHLFREKWGQPIFKRRFTHILRQWSRLLEKSSFMQYLNILGTSLGEVSDPVLIYEHCHCIHELLKEVDSTLKKRENHSSHRTSIVQRDLFNFDQGQGQEEEDAACLQIQSQLNYAQLFQIVAQKTIPLISHFQTPNVVWNMVNYLTFLLEKNCGNSEGMVECFKALNLSHLLSMNSVLLDEAIIDMVKHIFVFQGSSPVILDMCTFILDAKLGQKPSPLIVQFWLFTTRAVAEDNPSLRSLHALFQKYGAYGEAKKDYIAIDFFKILQELALLNFFSTQTDVQNLTNYVNQKFIQESAVEKQWIMGGSQQAEQEMEDNTSLYEKKLNLIQIMHILIWKAQDSPVLPQILQALKPLTLTLLEYVSTCSICKTIPSSSTFFTALVTFLNRIIIAHPDSFIQCLRELQASRNLSLHSFVQAWISKMETLVSQESRRINLIAIYTFLPYLPSELVQSSFNDFGKITFSSLNSYLYLKVTNNESRFYSPTKVVGTGGGQNAKVRINQTEKLSQRAENLKRGDSLMEVDIVDYFKLKMELTKRNLAVANYDPFRDCLLEQHWKEVFDALVSGANLQ